MKRKVLYWLDMSAEIEEVVKNCSKCAEFQNKLPRLPLKPTETPELPFEHVASDIFEFEGKKICKQTMGPSIHRRSSEASVRAMA